MFCLALLSIYLCWVAFHMVTDYLTNPMVSMSIELCGDKLPVQSYV